MQLHEVGVHVETVRVFQPAAEVGLVAKQHPAFAVKFDRGSDDLGYLKVLGDVKGKISHSCRVDAVSARGRIEPARGRTGS